jgi:colicin import membrane protein
MKNITRTISLALTIGISVLAADMALAQQGKGNKKEEEQTNQQKGKSEQAKGKEHSNRPANPRERAEERGAEAKANAQHNKAEEKSAKGNKGKDDDKTNNGNAYGKNKGELSGREFGQARAASARLNNEEKQEKLNKVVTEGDEKVTEARGRVARALEELERNRKARTISDAEYNEKKARITRAEQAIQVLEEKVREGKALTVTIE